MTSFGSLPPASARRLSVHFASALRAAPNNRLIPRSGGYRPDELDSISHCSTRATRTTRVKLLGQQARIDTKQAADFHSQGVNCKLRGAFDPFKMGSRFPGY
jgi:hypothetical protein